MALHPVRQGASLVLAFAIVALIGAIADTAGVTPWLLVAGALGLVSLALARRMPLDLAVAGAFSSLLALYSVLIHVSPALGADLGTVNRITLVVVSVVAGVVAWRGRATGAAPGWRSIAPLVLGLAPLVVTLLGLAVVLSTTGGSRVGFALRNDAVWNTMTARFLWDDGGASPLHPNPSPLTGALLAASFAPGRVGLDPALLLEHDVTRQAQLWLLMVLATSVLAGLVAFRALRDLSPVALGFAVFGVACIPASWYAAGYAFRFGFYNATLSLLLLLCAWIAWSAARSAVTASIVMLALTTVATLATWAPLAIVPVALIAVSLVLAGREWWRGVRGARLALLIAAALAVVGYALAATLPDLLREGGALAAEGAMFPLVPRDVVVVTVVTVAAVFVAAVVRRSWRFAIGTAAVVVAAAIALGYLVFQRRALESLWGYYPSKFAWLVLSLLLVLLAVSLLGWATGRVARIVLVFAGSAVVVGGLAAMPLPDRESVTSLAGIAVPALGALPESTPPLLFAESDPRTKTLVSGIAADYNNDRLINNWLLQQAATDSKDEIRTYAYLLDPIDVAQLCGVAELWGGGVTVRSADPALQAALDDHCPSAGVTVELD